MSKDKTGKVRVRLLRPRGFGGTVTIGGVEITMDWVQIDASEVIEEMRDAQDIEIEELGE